MKSIEAHVDPLQNKRLGKHKEENLRGVEKKKLNGVGESGIRQLDRGRVLERRNCSRQTIRGIRENTQKGEKCNHMERQYTLSSLKSY